MRRLLWPLALVVAFGLGLAAAGLAGHGQVASQEVERLQMQVSTLQAQLRAWEARMVGRPSVTAGSTGWEQGDDSTAGANPGSARPVPLERGSRPRAEPQSDRAALEHGGRVTAASTPSVDAALDRFSTSTWTRGIGQEGRGAGSGCSNWRTSCGAWEPPVRKRSCGCSPAEPAATSVAPPPSSLGAAGSRGVAIAAGRARQGRRRPAAARGGLGAQAASDAGDRPGPGRAGRQSRGGSVRAHERGVGPGPVGQAPGSDRAHADLRRVERRRPRARDGLSRAQLLERRARRALHAPARHVERRALVSTAGHPVPDGAG